MGGGTFYRVGSGECMASIADAHGFFWETLWDWPENADLKKKRKNPNVLKEGDEVFIPEMRPRQEQAATEKTNRFRRKGVPSKARFQFLSGGKPRADLPFTCDLEGQKVEGRTDKDGVVSFSVPPGVKKGTLTLRDKSAEEVFDLSFGELDPIDDVTGVQQRLRNLGFDCEVTGELDPPTLDALSSFQAREKLADSEGLDDATRDALLRVHGA